MIEKTEVEIDFSEKDKSITISGFKTNEDMDAFMNMLVENEIVGNIEPVSVQ